MAKRYASSEQILAELGEAATVAAKNALADGADAIVQDAKERCPVYNGKDKRVVKGALRDSIHKVKRRKGASYRIVADARSAREFPYGRIIEFSPKIAKPFMYPAYDAQRDSIRAGIIAAVRKACRRKNK